MSASLLFFTRWATLLMMHFIMNFIPYACFYRQEVRVYQLLLLTLSRCPALFGNFSLLLC